MALLRSDDETGVAPPLPSVSRFPALVDQARAGGLAVELHVQGDLFRCRQAASPSTGSPRRLANAARHAPRARTILGLELTNGRIAFVAETTGPVTAAAASDRERPRYGLIGMQERATALGGQFAAGPTSDGWRVSCGFPLEDRVIG